MIPSMPDESCRICGGPLVPRNQCIVCRKTKQEICKICGSRTLERFHGRCFFGIESVQTASSSQKLQQFSTDEHEIMLQSNESLQPISPATIHG